MEQVDTFPQYVEWVLFAEGKYADDENDRGGVTHWGLSSKFLASINWGDIPPTRDQAIELYRKYYWKGNRCDQMHPVVAWCAMDAYVQHQHAAAGRLIQVGLGVTPDGVVGPKTIAASASPNLLLFIQRYRLQRIRHYNAITQNDESQEDFIDGWHDRLHKLMEGLFFAGLIVPNESNTGLTNTITSPAAKATGAGLGVGTLFMVLSYIGIEPSNLIEWSKQIAPSGGLVALITAWLAKHNFKV